MSHFSVLVIGNNIEAQLAPYQENNMGDCPKEYLQFVESPTQEEYEKEDAETREEYPTFEAYASEYHGATFHEDHQKFGHYENPKAKWDWYEVGGRWGGHFKVKVGTPVVMERGWSTPEGVPDGHSDVARKGDIDIAGMFEEARTAARKEWDLVMGIVGDRPLPNWPKIREELQVQGKSMDEIRDVYHSLPVMLDLMANDTIKSGWYFINESPFERYAGGNEQLFFQRREIRSLSTFAVLHKGQWNERGSMGWFGCVTDEKEPAIWEDEFLKLFNSLPDDTLLTVVDCHI